MQTPNDWTWGQFFKDYGGHLLGLLALVQVWLIALWRRFISKGKLSLYETAGIELGFSTFGATVGLLGTLRAERGDVFVKRMRVRVIRKKDKAEHVFTWRAFRPLELSVQTGQVNTLGIAGSFLITTSLARQYHVFFASVDFASQHNLEAAEVKENWGAFVIEKLKNSTPQQTTAFFESPTAQNDLFDTFLNEGHATALHTAIANEFYWRAGDYELELTVDNNGKPAALVKKWPFTLSDDDESSLRQNALKTIREICMLNAKYTFVYKDYKVQQSWGS